MKALTFTKLGGPDVLSYTDVAAPLLKQGELLVEMKAIGLNFADIYRRTGVFSIKGSAPYINGYEGAGVVVDANENTGFTAGDRVAFADVPFANAELVVVPVGHIIPLPDDISFETASSVLLQGLTAQYLTNDSHKVQKGEVVVVHAAAGGVGQWLIQISKAAGAVVIGLTTSDDKRQLILDNGADAVFNLKADWKNKVLEFTNGRGADVVYDSVGSTILDSVAATRSRGDIVFYGMSGGTPLAVDPILLMDGSKTLIGGDLWDFLTSSEERTNRASQLFGWVREGKITLREPVIFPLSEGRMAHEFLETGKSAGKVLLIP